MVFASGARKLSSDSLIHSVDRNASRRLWSCYSHLPAPILTPPSISRFPTPFQVYGNKTAVDDELVDILLTPGGDDGAEEVFLKVLRAPAGPSPEQLLPRIQVPIIGIWGVSRCRGRMGMGGGGVT